MNSLSLALKKANVVTDEDIERVQRQKRTEEEQRRKEAKEKKINELIEAIHPQLRGAVKSARKKNPEVITVAVLKKLSTAKQNPLLLLDPEVRQAMNYVMAERIRLELEEAE
jgi:hypothetical protein